MGFISAGSMLQHGEDGPTEHPSAKTEQTEMKLELLLLTGGNRAADSSSAAVANLRWTAKRL